MVKLNLDRDMINQSRESAEVLVRPLQRYISMHSTVAVERAVLRLLGFSGGYRFENGVEHPLVNLIVEKISKKQLSNGVASLIAAVKKKHPKLSQQKIAEDIISGTIDLQSFEELPPDKAQGILKPWVEMAQKQIDRSKSKKEEQRYRFFPSNRFLKNVCLSTGNIQEDAKLAQFAAKHGADIITLIRSTAQSLLEYVPQGETLEGYGGTFVSQENIAHLRRALNDVSRRTESFSGLAIDSSGLCMPEITVIGILENVDFMVNDALYAILFRDINMKRTMIDQHFSRTLLGKAGISLQTSEENFLQGKDGYLKQHELLAAHFINEQLARHAGLRDDQIGLSHAFEVDPKNPDSIVFEIAAAQVYREIFPRAPIRYVAPRFLKSKTPGLTSAFDTVFHLVGLLTNQNQQLLCVPHKSRHFSTFEQIHGALKSAQYMLHAGRSLGDELQFSSNGKIMRRARMILEDAHKILQQVSQRDFFEIFESGMFCDVVRKKDTGKGFDGIFQKSRKYYNPFLESASA